MDDTQIDLVQRSFAAIRGRASQLAGSLYQRLFEIDPSLRSMFPTDMAAQQQKLMDELTIIVERLTDVAALADRSLDLGRRHREYGVEPQHYVVLRDALLFALAEVMEVPLDDATSLAWRRAYNLIAEVMMHGASHGRQSSPAP